MASLECDETQISAVAGERNLSNTEGGTTSEFTRIEALVEIRLVCVVAS